MQKICKMLAAFFALLTFIGAGYVLYHQGQVSAGYACTPMILCVACLSIARTSTKK